MDASKLHIAPLPADKPLSREAQIIVHNMTRRDYWLYELKNAAVWWSLFFVICAVLLYPLYALALAGIRVFYSGMGFFAAGIIFYYVFRRRFFLAFSWWFKLLLSQTQWAREQGYTPNDFALFADESDLK